MKLYISILIFSIASIFGNTKSSEVNIENDKEDIISSCLVQLISKGLKISDTEGRRYLDCTVYFVENGYLESSIEPKLIGEKVCILDPNVLFQIEIDTYLEISKFKIYPDSAEIDIQFYPSENEYHFKLSKKQKLWMVH